MSGYFLEMTGITKEFPGVKALNNVNLNVKKGEVHALCGENGAGKSTLMKVLGGFYASGEYTGNIMMDGKELTLSGIKDGEKAGIAVIYQELALFNELSVAENIFMGHEDARLGILDEPEMLNSAQKKLEELSLDISPYSKVGDLGTGRQQLVEIAKALSRDARIIIMDEPTASLSDTEAALLLGIIRRLKDNGTTIIYISHKLDEVFSIADTITVLRDGSTVLTQKADSLSKSSVISAMVGREMAELYPERTDECGETVFKAGHFSIWEDAAKTKLLIDDASFSVGKGEVLGFAGLIGAGRTELMSAIFGNSPGPYKGELELSGVNLKIRNPQDALKAGIAMVPEDRKRSGIVGIMSVLENMTLAHLSSFGNKAGIIDEPRELSEVQIMSDRFRVKAASLDTPVGNLSGGNQQKVIIARCLMGGIKVLILDEPTRGIDVGARYEIYTLIRELTAQGIAVVMVSSDLPEIIGLSDRIMVMHEGKIKGEFKNKGITQEMIMGCALEGE
jgi:D-xylose transport system ATP-binding protein